MVKRSAPTNIRLLRAKTQEKKKNNGRAHQKREKEQAMTSAADGLRRVLVDWSLEWTAGGGVRVRGTLARERDDDDDASSSSSSAGGDSSSGGGVGRRRPRVARARTGDAYKSAPLAERIAPRLVRTRSGALLALRGPPSAAARLPAAFAHGLPFNWRALFAAADSATDELAQPPPPPPPLFDEDVAPAADAAALMPQRPLAATARPAVFTMSAAADAGGMRTPADHVPRQRRPLGSAALLRVAPAADDDAADTDTPAAARVNADGSASSSDESGELDSDSGAMPPTPRLPFLAAQRQRALLATLPRLPHRTAAAARPSAASTPVAFVAPSAVRSGGQRAVSSADTFELRGSRRTADVLVDSTDDNTRNNATKKETKRKGLFFILV